MINELHRKTLQSERHRYAYDLRNSEEDNSQRMLNMLLPDTEVPKYRQEETSETVVCLQGRLDVIFYVERPNMGADGPGREFQEALRTELCPAKGLYGVQIPKGAWHTIEVFEESTILEAKDGNYKA